MFSCRWCENLTHSFTGGVGVRDFTTSKNTLVKSHLQVREARTTPQQITAVVGRFPRILCGGQIGYSSKTMILCGGQIGHSSKTMILCGGQIGYSSKTMILCGGQIGHSSKLWFHTLSNAMQCHLECAKQSVTQGAFETPSHNFLNFSRSQKLLVHDVTNHILLCRRYWRNE